MSQSNGKGTGAGRPPVSLTQRQQIRLEAMRLVMDHPAWCANHGYRDWQVAVQAVAEFIEGG